MKYGFVSLLPPLVAIGLALLTRQVIVSLFVGVLVGASIIEGSLFSGFLATGEKFLIGAVADKFHAGILMFTLTIGGVIGLIGSMGGTKAIASVMAKYATTRRSSQLVTWFLGVLIFFDDYSNTLIVGPTMRPLTDRVKVSREKLAYIVDSTAAPIAGLALISTWLGYEISLIKSSFEKIGIFDSAYEVFINSIPYRFYDIFAIIMALAICSLGRDFGPMLKAEKRAVRAGKVLSDSAKPVSQLDRDFAEKKIDNPKMFNAVIPIVMLTVLSFFSLWYSGGGAERTFNVDGLRDSFGDADASVALLWAALITSICTVFMSIVQRIHTLEGAISTWMSGCQSLLITAVILVLAWALGGVTKEIDTAGYLVGVIGSDFPLWFIPIIVFLISCFVAFATGTSWGTMAVVIPLTVPLVTAMMSEQVANLPAIYASLGAVLSGAIFGDHCSPISDTTIMSSMAASCDHIDHVKTQIPYSIFVALVTILLGYLPLMAGISVWVCLLIGIIAIFAVVRFFGKRVV